MKIKPTTYLIACFLSTLFIGHPSFADEPLVQVLQSDEQAIVLEFSVDTFQLEEQWIDGRRFHVLSLPESGYTSELGAPQLPVKGVLIATPPAAEAHLTILEAEEMRLDGYHIPPVPAPTIHPTEDDQQSPLYEYKEDPDIYSANHFYPGKLAELSFSGMLRDQQVVGVRFYPLQYNPRTNQLRFYPTITVALNLTDINTSMSQSMRQTTPETFDPFESVYRNTILNYGSSRLWRGKKRRDERQFARQSTEESEKYKIVIREPGIYRVSADSLVEAGMELPVRDPRKIQLTHRGVEIPIEIDASDDGRFDVGDSITFYGTVDSADYSPYNVYWLGVGDADGLRIGNKNGNITGRFPVPESFLYTVHAEQNKPFRHFATFPNSETVDRFFWERIFAGDRFAFDVNLPFLADTDADCTVRVMLQGNTALAHHTRISLNGQLLEDATWHGQTQHFAEIRTPQTLLKEGVNTLNVEMPGDVAKVDIVYFNWFELEYHRRYITDKDDLEFRSQGNGAYRFVVEGFTQADVLVYDITEPTHPKRFINPKIERAGAEYRVSFADEGAKTYLTLTKAQTKKPVKTTKEVASNLRSVENGADYLIITHSDFRESILPLAQLREREGMRVKIVDVADIYDEFNHGLPNDTVIRDFIQYAYHHWKPPSPFALLLVGDASYDHKDYYGLGDENYVPTHLFNAPYFGDSAGDGWFVTVSGDDPLPDMTIGRLPVRTAAQTRAVVEKIIRYEQNPTPGDWQRHILLAADDGKIFEENSDQLSQKIAADYDVTKVYLSKTPATSAQRTIFNAFNQGCVVADYTGHGSWSRWAKEKILQTEDVELLSNTNKLPFVVNVTCLAGYFAHPLRGDILGENLVRAEGKGAIATLAACGMATASWQNLFNKLTFDRLFTGQHLRLGTTVMEAKIALIAHRGKVGDSEIYNLLGEPALKLALPFLSVAGDVNGDGKVDIVDLVLVGSHFGEHPLPFVQPNPDVNGDGVVDILDLVLVGAHFGQEDGFAMAAPAHNFRSKAVAVQLESAAPAGDIVSTDIKVKGAFELQGIQWSLNFDPSRLEVLQIREGNFLSQDGEICYWRPADIDARNGRILGTAATRFAKKGISGEGVLATVYFRLKTDDFDCFKHLRLTDVKAANSTGKLEVFINERPSATSQQ